MEDSGDRFGEGGGRLGRMGEMPVLSNPLPLKKKKL